MLIRLQQQFVVHLKVATKHSFKQVWRQSLWQVSLVVDFCCWSNLDELRKMKSNWTWPYYLCIWGQILQSTLHFPSISSLYRGWRTHPLVALLLSHNQMVYWRSWMVMRWFQWAMAWVHHREEHQNRRVRNSACRWWWSWRLIRDTWLSILEFNSNIHSLFRLRTCSSGIASCLWDPIFLQVCHRSSQRSSGWRRSSSAWRCLTSLPCCCCTCNG